MALLLRLCFCYVVESCAVASNHPTKFISPCEAEVTEIALEETNSFGQVTN